MSTLKRNEFPPGGWSYFQSATGWSAPTPTSSTFDQSVILIIKHRQQNPAAVLKYKLSLDFNTVANELDLYTRLRLGIPLSDPGPSPFPQPPRSLPAPVEAAVAGIKKLASGVALLFEWEESGQPPVASRLSNQRAAICANQCRNVGEEKNPEKKNEPENLSKYFTAPVSEMVRKRLARLFAMKLTTTSDLNLGVCAVCLCPLKLKVHTPMDLILKHTKPETLKEFPPHCWIAKRDQGLTLSPEPVSIPGNETLSETPRRTAHDSMPALLGRVDIHAATPVLGAENSPAP
jgi:hypothetical protein